MLDALQIDIWPPFAGLMIFLLAMGFIESAIRKLAGRKVKEVIASNTDHPVRGVLTGTVATALLQSSSLVSLLVLAFVGARIMRLKQALLTVFGANLGTTATGWVVALVGFKLDLDAISLPMIAVFGLLFTAVKDGRLKQFGQLGLGVGLLLLALEYMKSALGDAETTIDPDLLAGFALWQYALFGIAASAFMQSSSAVMVLTLSAIHSDIIDLHAGAALMIGADLGTTSTVIFGSIAGTANKKRVALGHVIFNLVTDAIAFIFLVPLVAIAAVMEDPLLSLVAFHTLFNVIGVLIWTPLVGYLAQGLERLFRTPATQVARYLNPESSAVEESAITALGNELDHLAERVLHHNAMIFSTNIDEVPTKDEYRADYRDTKQLEAEILQFALALRTSPETEEYAQALDQLLESARNLLLASKLCKDNLNDFRELADYQPQLYSRVATTQREFYEDIPPPSELKDMEREDFEALTRRNERGHDALHEEIYLSIKGVQLPRDKVSTLLNLNRALFNSNTVLLAGLNRMAAYRNQPPALIAAPVPV